MGLPFLMLLFSFILSLGFAFLNKTTVAIEARNEIWKLRDDESHWKDDALSVWSAADTDSGVVEDELSKNSKVATWLGGTLAVRSKAAVLTGTWDSRQVRVFDKEEPHLTVIEKMLGGSGEVTEEVVSAIHQLLKLGSLPGQEEIEAANDEKNKAEEERDEKIEEMEDDIEEMKEELKKLEEERQKLQDEYDELERQRDDLKKKQDDLREQAEKFPPGSKERQDLLDQADALDDDIKDVEDKMGVKNGEIRAKDQEIAAKKKEIDIYETELEKAKEAIGAM